MEFIRTHTQAYLARRTAEGKTKKETTRCLKRLPIREVWGSTKKATREG